MLLAGAAVVQMLTVALFYARVYHSGFPGALKSWVDVGPLEYLRFAFYFPFGVVCGMFPRAVRDPLARFKPILPWLGLLFFGLSCLESALAYNLGGGVWPIGGDHTKFTSALFSTALVLCFVAYDKLPLPFSRTVNKLGTHSYGLYLCHYPLLGILARVIARVAPWVAAQGWLFLPLLFGLTVALSMLLMEGVARLPTKRLYRYLFG
jgi:peptidoglycan/LPS O-acetylase OafA/YrhL